MDAGGAVGKYLRASFSPLQQTEPHSRSHCATRAPRLGAKRWGGDEKVRKKYFLNPPAICSEENNAFKFMLPSCYWYWYLISFPRLPPLYLFFATGSTYICTLKWECIAAHFSQLWFVRKLSTIFCPLIYEWEKNSGLSEDDHPPPPFSDPYHRGPEEAKAQVHLIPLWPHVDEHPKLWLGEW